MCYGFQHKITSFTFRGFAGDAEDITLVVPNGSLGKYGKAFGY
jgi:hypothetical protein